MPTSPLPNQPTTGKSARTNWAGCNDGTNCRQVVQVPNLNSFQAHLRIVNDNGSMKVCQCPIGQPAKCDSSCGPAFNPACYPGLLQEHLQVQRLCQPGLHLQNRGLYLECTCACHPKTAGTRYRPSSRPTLIQRVRLVYDSYQMHRAMRATLAIAAACILAPQATRNPPPASSSSSTCG